MTTKENLYIETLVKNTARQGEHLINFISSRVQGERIRANHFCGSEEDSEDYFFAMEEVRKVKSDMYKSFRSLPKERRDRFWPNFYLLITNDKKIGFNAVTKNENLLEVTDIYSQLSIGEPVRERDCQYIVHRLNESDCYLKDEFGDINYHNPELHWCNAAVSALPSPHTFMSDCISYLQFGYTYRENRCVLKKPYYEYVRDLLVESISKVTVKIEPIKKSNNNAL